MTSTDKSETINDKVLSNYFGSLINLIYKILPLWENKECTLYTYIKSLQRELIGCEELIKHIDYDGRVASIIFILEYISSHIDDEEMDHSVIKREIFKAIDICKKLNTKLIEKGD